MSIDSEQEGAFVQDSADPVAPEPHRPIRRAYTPISRKVVRDVDSFGRVTRVRIFLWSLVGAFMGFLLGFFLTTQGMGGWIVPVAMLIGWAVVFICALFVVEGAGRAGSTLYAPSGRSTPRKREYSLAESYVARADYERAVAAFEEAIAEQPDDPLPYLRIARLRRDRLDDPEGAARCFKRALEESRMPPGMQLLARKELIELYEVRMGAPRRAAPWLARIAEESAGTPEGAWAAAELARIKAEMARDTDAS
jgi:tetratricopeptide (TPR) repeat protein